MGVPISRRTELQDSIDALMRSNKELERVHEDNLKLIKELRELNEHLNKTI